VRSSSVDARFVVRGAQGPGDDVVLVGIDDSSLAQLPRWPFSRTLHARMLRRPAGAGARLIVYDVDFGIAHDTNAQDAQHDGQRVAGGPEYLAPEQLGVGEIGPWTDVYALAGVLVFCLTGAPPFPRATVSEMLAAHLTAPPPRSSALCPELPSALDRVLLRGLAKAPEARPQTVLEFAAEVITPRRPSPLLRRHVREVVTRARRRRSVIGRARATRRGMPAAAVF
jgi:serine/threonine protein kinase